MAPRGPAQIGKYHVLDLIGEGAMGIVYRAEDTVLNRVVAVKVMNESIARQADLRDRFLREAQLAGSLSHPNVVTVYDFGETDGHLFIAMEFVPGIDLETMLLQRAPMKLQQKLEMTIDVLTALAYAHKRGIVHRDVKPANIRITEDGRAKLMDFGVAHLAASTITRTGEQMGTPSYMSPEQVTGGRVTPASDLFAVGCVLYELIAGSRPFGGPTLHTVMYKIVSEEPTPLTEMVPGMPPALERAVQRALAKDVEQRYQSALEMADDLTAVRAGLSGSAGPGTLSLRATHVMHAPPVAAPPAPVRSGNAARWAGIAAALVVVGGLAWSLGMRRANNATPGVSPAPVAAAVATDAPPATPAASVAASAPRAPEVPDAPPVPNATSGSNGEAARDVGRRRIAEQRPSPAPPSPAPSVAQSTPAAPAPTPNTPPIAVPTASPEPRVAPAATATVTPPATPAPAPTSAAPDPARIPDAIAAYAHAIESRDLGALRQAYPGMTVAQEHNFSQFFDATRSMKVTLSIAGVEQSGASADVRVVGSYDFVTAAGRSERQPVNFHATLRHDGARWRLASVR